MNVVLRSRAYCTVAELLGGADLWTDGTRIAWMMVSILVSKRGYKIEARSDGGCLRLQLQIVVLMSFGKKSFRRCLIHPIP